MSDVGIIILGLIFGIVALFFSIFILILPAKIASKKGKSFGLWLIYSIFLWPIALIHSILLDDIQDNQELKRKNGEADLLLKYKKLLDEGAITEEEYNRKKQEFLNN